MQKTIKTEKIPIKLWLDEIEPGALQQAKNLANFPFAFSHIAIMPDAHQGYGMPIGAILATQKVVVPNAVGVDIGCGMCALRTPLKKIKLETLKEIINEIRKKIPLGFARHKKRQPESKLPVREEPLPIVDNHFKDAQKQVGTLGGGNHFIEIQKGSDGFIWIMLHSGSRNLGKRVADHYNQLAKKNRKKWKSTIPKNWQLDFLPLDSKEGKNYWKEMNYCAEFALANRRAIMEELASIFKDKTEASLNIKEMINIAHNYAAREKHFGQEVIIHRKGATQARKGQLGIIPGSQGDKSYIVKGLGNPESFQSCSHGAGRLMGRNFARKNLILEKEVKKLNQKGIIHSIKSFRDLDEAPSAYKKIEKVMKNQADLVEIVIELEPLAVVKS